MYYHVDDDGNVDDVDDDGCILYSCFLAVQFLPVGIPMEIGIQDHPGPQSVVSMPILYETAIHLNMETLLVVVVVLQGALPQCKKQHRCTDVSRAQRGLIPCGILQT
jgi:hypothetical protein